MNLSLETVSKKYGTQLALDELTFAVEDAHCVALIGPSGGGKSTTLRLLAALESPDSGKIRFNGMNLEKHAETPKGFRKTVGVVFQAYNLFPHFDALTNVALPLEKAHGWNKKEALARAERVMEQFDLSDHRFKKPAELSGGQNQRVAIARALAPNPDTILLDEPTSALDPEMTAEVLDAIHRLVETKKDLVIATHQMGFAKQAADVVALIAEGRLIESGPAEQVISAPQTPRGQKFLSACLTV